jgi:hypothetical protein
MKKKEVQHFSKKLRLKAWLSAGNVEEPYR